MALIGVAATSTARQVPVIATSPAAVAAIANRLRVVFVNNKFEASDGFDDM